LITAFIEGPLWYFALIVFLTGIVWRLFAIARIGSKPDLSVPQRSAAVGGLMTSLRRFLPRREIGPRIRLHVVAGYMFHLGLFAVLLFAAPHVLFLEEHLLGFGWTPMPYWAFIVTSQLAFAGLLLLWLHRVLNPVTRLISDADDHVAAVLTFVVMLTGCLALMEAFTGLRVLHRFTVELLMIYFPFSRLMHAFTFIPSRAYTGALFGRRGVDA
jgi:nitrate reductase gamma subunit